MSEHWAAKQERGNLFALRLVARLIRYCPMWLLAILSRIVVLYFFMTSPAERRNIRDYQQHLRSWSGRSDLLPAFARFTGNLSLSDRRWSIALPSGSNACATNISSLKTLKAFTGKCSTRRGAGRY